MISLTRELTSDLDVDSCSQLGFFIHAESLGLGRAAGYNPVGQDKYIPYLTLHSSHTQFPRTKTFKQTSPNTTAFSDPMDSFRLSAPYSAFLPTAEQFPLKPYHIGLFLLQLLECAALERSSVLLICSMPVAKRHACDFKQ